MKIIGHRRGVVRLAYAIFVLASTLATNANAQTLPAGWTVSNIGSPVISGSATHSSGTFSVSGAGTDIWGSSDQFTFAHRRLTGDATIVARVATLQNVNAWSKAGVMIRGALAANSKHASVFVTPLNGVAFQRRRSTGGTSVQTNWGTGTAPVWLKLVRRSSTLTAIARQTARHGPLSAAPLYRWAQLCTWGWPLPATTLREQLRRHSQA